MRRAWQSSSTPDNKDIVIPAQAGIQISTLDSRLRGNDGTQKNSVAAALIPILPPNSHFGKRQLAVPIIPVGVVPPRPNRPGSSFCLRNSSKHPVLADFQ
jgi:hypothetical protein